MRLLTLNVWEGKLPVPLQALFEAERPDIACLQEVRDLNPGYDWIQPNLDRISRMARLSCAVFSPVMEIGWMRDRMRFGNAVLAGQPALYHHTIWTHGQFNPDFDMAAGDPVPRNIQHVTYPELNVLNCHHHRDRGAHKNGSEADLATWRKIAAYVTGMDRVIIAGDFNLVPSSPALQPLWEAGFRNLAAEYKITSTRTWLKGRDEVSDNILVKGDIRVRDFYVSKFVASDHAALVLDFE